jgi:multisubunit Na+/H+ antiporter MnhG subunit
MSVRDYADDVLVALAVATELVACLGVVVMRSAIDRLHYAGAGATIPPAFVAAAVCVREGIVSAQGVTAILIAVVLALGGAAVGAATGRLARLDSHGTIESSPAERRRAPS